MTYKFLCRYFKPRVAAWLTVTWFALLLIVMFALSVFSEESFIYINF
jgi:hypothetical protein